MEAINQENKKEINKNQDVDFEFTTSTQANEAIAIASHHKPSTLSSSNLSLELETISEEDIDSTSEIKQHAVVSQELSTEFISQTPGSSMKSATSTTSPQFLMNGKASGYDPNRIPTSVFTGKPSTPMEWSMTSNESLFSIHVGNNSFSREAFIMMQKSGDLTNLYMKPDEVAGMPTMPNPVKRSVGELPKSNESIDIPNSLLPINEGKVLESINLKSEEAKIEVKAKHIETSETKRINLEESSTQNNREKMPPLDDNRPSNCVSHVSDESCTSATSFQFPVLSGDGGMSSPGMNNQDKQQLKKEMQSQPPKTTLKEAKAGWFSCCYCCRSPC